MSLRDEIPKKIGKRQNGKSRVCARRAIGLNEKMRKTNSEISPPISCFPLLLCLAIRTRFDHCGTSSPVYTRLEVNSSGVFDGAAFVFPVVFF